MSEVREKRQYTIIHHAISVLTTLCCGDVNTTVDLLTGYLWDEEEAGHIKQVLAELEAESKPERKTITLEEARLKALAQVKEARERPIEGDIEDESGPSGYCSGCFSKTIHHTCGKEPDADKVQAMQSLPMPEKCKHTMDDLMTKAGIASTCPICTQNIIDRQAEEIAKLEKIISDRAAQGMVEMGFKESKPEPGEFTKKLEAFYENQEPNEPTITLEKAAFYVSFARKACQEIDRQAKQLKEMEASLSCDSLFGRLAAKDKEIERLKEAQRKPKCVTCYDTGRVQAKKDGKVIISKTSGPCPFCEKGRGADELVGGDKCQYCGACRVTRPSGEWQFMCECDEPDKRPSRTEPLEFTKRMGNNLRCSKPDMREACGIIERQVEELAAQAKEIAVQAKQIELLGQQCQKNGRVAADNRR